MNNIVLQTTTIMLHDIIYLDVLLQCQVASVYSNRNTIYNLRSINVDNENNYGINCISYIVVANNI